jgi:hypothetical protein
LATKSNLVSVDLLAGGDAGAADLEAAPRVLFQQPLGHLAAARVLDAYEKYFLDHFPDGPSGD